MMKRENIVWGVILILAGVGFLLYQLRPGLFAGISWTWIFFGLGGVFVLASLLTRVGGLMIPGAVLLGLGGIFIYQVNTGDWESWAYVWALLPGFAGLGMLLGGLYDRELAHTRGVAFFLLALSAICFVVFGGFFGLQPSILRYWPVALILVGAYIFLRALRPREK
jgi:hypothetical protein